MLYFHLRNTVRTLLVATINLRYDWIHSIELKRILSLDRREGIILFFYAGLIIDPPLPIGLDGKGPLASGSMLHVHKLILRRV